MQVGDQERRSEPRNRVHLWAVAQRDCAEREAIAIADLSCVGFKMRTAGRHELGDAFILDVAGNLVAEVGVVRANEASREYGCRFLHPLPPATVHRLLEQGGATSQSRVDETFRAGTTAQR